MIPAALRAQAGAKPLRRHASSWLSMIRRSQGGIQPGKTRPALPVPEHIVRPPYAETGDPGAAMPAAVVLSEEQTEAMVHATALARDVLDLAGTLVMPGVQTCDLDDQLHKAIIARNGYPSPLNYRGFPRSNCISVNEIVCHGIPDDRPLEDGDVVSIDVSCFLNGVHGDTCRTFYVGEPDDETRHLVRTTKRALDAAIAICGPGVPVSEIGEVIERVANKAGLGTVREFVGHGIGPTFHTRPQVFHFAGSRSTEVLQAGTCFTIEPMLTAGSPKVTLWRDGWTVATADRKRSAQFEHTLHVTESGVEVLTAYDREFEEDAGANRLA